MASFTRKQESDSWDDSSLADDVAVLTYEEALHSTRQARITKPATDPMLDDPAKANPAYCAVGKSKRRDAERKQRNATVTIRLTNEEQAQLHARAAAARLSISAYLRSCIFEAESLRSQVKAALAEMQSTQSTPSASGLKGLVNWRRRLFPAWSRSRTSES